MKRKGVFVVLSSIRAIWCRNGTCAVPNFLARRRTGEQVCPTVRGCAVHHVRGRIRYIISARGGAPAAPVPPCHVPLRTHVCASRVTVESRLLSSIIHSALVPLSSMTSLELSLRSPPVCWGLGRFRAHARCTPHPPQSVVSDHNSRTWKSHPQAHANQPPNPNLKLIADKSERGKCPPLRLQHSYISLSGSFSFFP